MNLSVLLRSFHTAIAFNAQTVSIPFIHFPISPLTHSKVASNSFSSQTSLFRYHLGSTWRCIYILYKGVGLQVHKKICIISLRTPLFLSIMAANSLHLCWQCMSCFFSHLFTLTICCCWVSHFGNNMRIRCISVLLCTFLIPSEVGHLSLFLFTHLEFCSVTCLFI